VEPEQLEMLVERGVVRHRHINVAGRFDTLSPVGNREPSYDDRRPADLGEFLGDNGRGLEQTLGLIIDRRRLLKSNAAVLSRRIHWVCHHAPTRPGGGGAGPSLRLRVCLIVPASLRP
jgi:hypothetical protein